MWWAVQFSPHIRNSVPLSLLLQDRHDPFCRNIPRLFYKTPPYDTCSFPRSPFLDTAKPDGKVAEVWRADSGGKDDSNDH